jgi:hypothetical protein
MPTASGGSTVNDRLASLEKDVALVKQEQSHQRELFNTQFNAVENHLSSIDSRLAEWVQAIQPDIENVRAIGKAFRWIAGSSLLAGAASLLAILKVLGAF